MQAEPARTVIVAGAGIGGLSAALALAGHGFRAVVLEEAAELSDIGAGIQLSPNATRVLLALGLKDRLKPHIVAPDEVRIQTGTGEHLARIPLGKFVQARYGAPYWVIHRGDLQTALADAVRATPDITLTLNAEVEKFAADAEGVTVQAMHNRTSLESDDGTSFQTHGIALIGADGLSSIVRFELASKFLWSLRARGQPRYSNRTAWRATIPYTAAPADFREAVVHLWLGRNAHLVHYPVKDGTAINIVAIAGDRRDRANWAAHEATPDEVLAHYPRSDWSKAARDLLAAPQLWLRWPLFDRPPSRQWGRGPVTLLGDAAHPMLPFLAQGAAMAIEDAAVLADCLRTTPDEPAQALRRYEDQRQARTARVQRTAHRNGLIYHLGAPAAFARDFALRNMSGERLLMRFDWLYDWRSRTDPE
jgi:salicylate hydroxylase